jgi:hypothetical protein
MSINPQWVIIPVGNPFPVNLSVGNPFPADRDPMNPFPADRDPVEGLRSAASVSWTPSPVLGPVKRRQAAGPWVCW